MSFRTRLPRNSPRAETRCLETRSLTAHSGSGGHIKMTTKENEAKDRRVVIVAGAQGVSGNAVLKQYAALPGTIVYGLSRRPSESSGNIQHISVDLLSPDDVKAKLGQLKEITHFFFGAYVEKPTAT